MAASATIDMVSIENPTVSENSGKSCVPDSHDFANVLDSVNKKSYSSSEKQSSKQEPTNNTTSSTKDLKNSKEDAPSDKVQNNTGSQEKVDETKTDKTTKTENPDTKNTEATKVDNATTTNSTPEEEQVVKAEATNETAVIEEVISNVDNTQVKPTSSSQESSPSPVLDELKALIEAAQTDSEQADTVPAQVPQEAVANVEPQPQVQTNTVPDNEKKPQVDADSTKTDDTDNTVTQVAQVQIQASAVVLPGIPDMATQVPSPEVSDLANQSSNQATNQVTTQAATQAAKVIDDGTLTKQAQNDVSAAVTKTVQPQTQQVASNMKVDQVDNLQPQQSQVAQAQETNAKAPVIEVNTEQMASDVTLKNLNTKQDLNEVLDKIPLTQEMIDKTHAKIANVQTSTNSNPNPNPNPDNLLNQQNAQEQVIKLSVQNSNNILQSVNLAETSNTLNQPVLDKTLNNVPTQVSKEISNTDVLTQINSRINNLNEETSKITIILKPENLGKINIELVNGKGGLTAQIITDSPQVKEILDKNLDSLRNNLGDNGVNVNNVSVKVNEVAKQDNSLAFDLSEQGNKQSQDNKQAQENKNPLSGASDDLEGQEEELAGIETEETVSVEAHDGQVDYRA